MPAESVAEICRVLIAVPAVEVWLPGLVTVTVSLPVGLTVRVKVVVCVAEAPVPLIVTVELPEGVLLVVAMVSVELAPEFTDDGLNDAVAPVGRPEALSAIDWAEPLVSVVETVAVSEPPGLTEPEVGETAIEKSLVPAVQVGSPDWAGTLTASHAAFTVLNWAHEESRFFAAVRVHVRYFR